MILKSRSKISGTHPSPHADGGVLALVNIEPGQGGVVVRIEEGLKPQIAAMGIRVGCRIGLEERQPMSGPLVVRVGDMVTSIGRRLALGIQVEVDR